MKTVQQWLKDVDRENLLGTYQFLYPPDFMRLKNEEMSVAEVYNRQKEIVSDFIDHLIGLETQPNEDQMIFLAVSAYNEGRADTQAVLVSANELNQDQPDHYDWMMTDREKLAGYDIADTEATIDEICTVLAQIIEDATFLGYSQETFTEEREKLCQSLKESEEDIKNGRVYSAEEVWEHLGLKPEKKDPEAQELQDKVTRAEITYNQYSLRKELGLLRHLLVGEGIDLNITDENSCTGKPETSLNGNK